VQLTPDPAGTRAGGGPAPLQLTPDSAGTRTGSGPAPVQLTPDPEAIDSADLLVNLSARLPARWQRFARIAEVIDADEERRRLGRERFKIYRDSKLTVETHQLDDAASG
jgi:DNA polymerase IIIc chi subunit